MTEENYIISERKKKLQALQEAGVNPYPSRVQRTYYNNQVMVDFENLEGTEVKIVGRLRALRGHGKLTFAQLEDGTGSIQIAFEQDKLGKEKYKILKKFDVGDFIQVTGEPFLTHKQVKTVRVLDFAMLTKSMRPLPEKWHGIKDEEKRYRQRYLDMLLNPEIRDMFRQKQKFWNVARHFLQDKGFMSVETPTLETTTGGAEAEPFRTHHNAFDLDVCLRISVGELWQKRLMAAGFEKTFEIGRVYRNEGSDPNHLQEFTNLEFYWAYANYEDGMKLVTELYQELATKVFGTTKFSARGHEFDLDGDWPRLDYCDEVKRQTGVDVLSASRGEMQSKLKELGVEWEGDSKERLTDTLWKYCRKNIAGPAFLTNHPKLVSPLAKEKSDDKNKTERFQVILAGTEIGNGYSELNNPQEQRARFELQQKLLESGDKEAMMPDWEFVEMLEYGMPPTCGFGFGEMLFAFMVDKPVRETTLFPLLKPESQELDSDKKSSSVPSTNSFASDLLNIDRAVTKRFDDLKIGAIYFSGLAVENNPEKLADLKKEILESIEVEKLLSFSPVLEDYRKILKQTGTDPSKKKPSPIALLDRLKSGKDLYEVNNLVDICNLMVLKYQISLGVFDSAKINLPITLTFSKGGEEFCAIGEDKSKKLKPGELVYKDDSRVLTRHLNYRDAEFSKITQGTKKAVVFFDGNGATDPGLLKTMMSELEDLVVKYVGGKADSQILFFKDNN